MYNKSEIMKTAWWMRREYKISMSAALKLAWLDAKIDVAHESGSQLNVRVHYSVYKHCALRRVRDSYDPDTKTIEVVVNGSDMAYARLIACEESMPELASLDLSESYEYLEFYIGKSWRKICA